VLYWLLNREERNAPADATATADSAAPR
jgi:hypothetical protein